jgi:pSer/pThr/pTyr-binding forkhead associated (FHA) protein
MHITLEPNDIPALTDIEIDDTVFPVGRATAPFDALPPDVVENLSRRHAKLFEEQGQVFVVDLGSRNGTTVNGETLGTLPRRLHDGDRLRFADLDFQLADHRLRASGEGDPGPVPELRLTPTEGHGGPEILITDFPCLIGRTVGPVAEFCSRESIDSRSLSRRHAHLYRSGIHVLLEDLGSTNGTTVNDQPLGDEPVTIRQGDRIRFAAIPALTFQATITTDACTAGASGTGAPVPSLALSQNTILIDHANTFLDIFCDPPADQPPPADAERDTAAPITPRFGRLQPGIDAMATLLNREIDVPGLKYPLPVFKYLSVAILVLTLLLTTVLVLRQDPVAEAESLVREGRYRDAAVLANTALTHRDDDPLLQRVALDATLHWLIPTWRGAIAGSDHGTAGALLEEAAEVAAGNREAEAIVSLLSWATQVEAWMAQRATGPLVVIDQDEERLAGLVRQWEDDRHRKQHYLGVIVQYQPTFTDYQAQLLSYIRKLEETASVYLPAIAALRRDLATALQVGDLAQGRTLLTAFARDYPAVGGIDRLSEDLATYDALLRLKQQGRLLELADQLATTTFDTALFRNHARESLRDAIPAEDVIQGYRQAERLWQQGQLAEAVAAMRSLAEDSDSRPVRDRLAARERILKNYQQLVSIHETPRRDEHIASLYRQLDPVADRYLHDTLAADFDRARQSLLEEAAGQTRAALEAWNTYERAGRIGGAMRLEDHVSEPFRHAAMQLSLAWERDRRARALRQLLDVSPDDEISGFQRQLDFEVALQRRSISDLRRLLGEELTARKLALLPPLADEPFAAEGSGVGSSPEQ